MVSILNRFHYNIGLKTFSACLLKCIFLEKIEPGELFPWATLAIDPLGNIIAKDGPADSAKHQSMSTICPRLKRTGWGTSKKSKRWRELWMYLYKIFSLLFPDILWQHWEYAKKYSYSSHIPFFLQQLNIGICNQSKHLWS